MGDNLSNSILKNKKTIVVCIFVCMFILQLFPFSFVTAEVNTGYGEIVGTITDDKLPSSVILEWIGNIAFNFGSFVETLTAKIMSLFTDVKFFPWADKIIFNSVPLFDVNFINPAKGSFFRGTNGDYTQIGNIVRSIYFTSLSIALSFLGIIVAVNAIRLFLSTLGAEKAKYKQAVTNAVMVLILLFALHYIYSLVFYMNEKLIESAGFLLTNVFTDENAQEIIAEFEESALKDDEQIIDNFVKECDPNWWSPIVIIREVLKELANGVKWLADTVVNIVSDIAEGIKSWWDSWWGDGEEEEGPDEYVISDKKEIERIYPRRSEMAAEFKKDDAHIHVTAYLLKSYTYREVYLRWVSGTDVNKITNTGIEGFAIGILSSINDFFGIVDSGYLGLRSVSASLELIFEGTYTTLEEESSGNKKAKNYQGLSSIINSTEDYNKYMQELESLRESTENEDHRDIYQIAMLYAEAYYKFVYDGDDKPEASVSDLITEMGKYFKSKSWYIDLENGGWAPTSVNVIFSILYSVFVIQSLMFVFAYIKRMFYVVILALVGPIVVVFDYLSKSI